MLWQCIIRSGATIRCKRFSEEEELLENLKTADELEGLLVVGNTEETVYQRHNRLWKKISAFEFTIPSTAITPFSLPSSC